MKGAPWMPERTVPKENRAGRDVAESTLLILPGKECDRCGDCVTACAKARPFAGRAALRIGYENGRQIPVLCRNCSDAPCVAACMPGCRHREEASGRVVTDYERCVGCWMCIMVCPFGAIQRIPAVEGVDHGVALKCDGCLDKEQAPCVAACKRQVLVEVEPAGLARRMRMEAGMKFATCVPTAKHQTPDALAGDQPAGGQA